MKRLLLGTAVLALLLAAQAFDSDAWHAYREEVLVDAARLSREYTNALKRVSMPAENVKFPVEMQKDGTVRTQIIAARAQMFLGSNYIWGSGVRVEHFLPDGTLDVVVEAEGCLVDRARRICWADGKVRAVRGKTVLEGRNAYIAASNVYIRVMNDAKVTSEDFELKGVEL